jgi:hypothetical protein
MDVKSRASIRAMRVARLGLGILEPVGALLLLRRSILAISPTEIPLTLSSCSWVSPEVVRNSWSRAPRIATCREERDGLGFFGT